MNLKNFHRKRVIVLTTTTLYKIVQSELYALGHDHEIVDKEGNLVFFDNKFQVMSKIMSYDEDIKNIVNHLFNGYGLEKEEHDTHFKKMFFYRFINREINRQTVESFMFELMSTFMINQGHINRVYNDLEKYILQHSTSETSNKQLSKEISQQINQQVATQIDERLNSENSTSGNTQNTDNTSKDNSRQSNSQNTDNTSTDHSIQNTTNNTTDESTGKTSSTSNQDTTQDTNQTVNGVTTSDNRQARSDLPQNRVNLDVNNTLMATANENEISRNKQTNTQDTDTNVTGNTKDTSSGTSESNATSKVIGNSDTKNTGESNTITTGSGTSETLGESNTITTGSNQSESNGESTGRTESDSHGQTDGTSDSESTGESSTLNMIYQLDELFKSSSVMEHIMNEFDKKCFLQFW